MHMEFSALLSRYHGNFHDICRFGPGGLVLDETMGGVRGTILSVRTDHELGAAVASQITKDVVVRPQRAYLNGGRVRSHGGGGKGWESSRGG